jgi:hypothetical protein
LTTALGEAHVELRVWKKSARVAGPFEDLEVIRQDAAMPVSRFCQLTGRPHRGIDLEIPVPRPVATVASQSVTDRVERVDVLGGLIHEYRRAARQ